MSHSSHATSHSLRRLGAVFAGGTIGTMTRALMIEVLPDTTGAMHWPTFLANVLGAFLLGWFVTRIAPTVRRNEMVLPFFAIGLFGSLTTFSALMVEIVESSRSGLIGGAIGYGAASVLIGLGAAAAGITLARVGR